MTQHRLTLKISFALLLILAAGLFIPERAVIPVEAASARDWNPKSFWHEPWGASGVHKGIDIFAPQGRRVVSATPGVVIYRGRWGRGGNVVAVLGPKWRVHYYAHLDSHGERSPLFVASGTEIGAVGTSGNAAGKPPHLHYTVFSLLPMPWRYGTGSQGWRKMFYLDPGAMLGRGA
ncbi:MAG: M23 family metallopeptidase [Burkholderiaceae bacterium]|jgi:murein DD-endopeptidase MepM/ murein hydrolase activator NlpD|nr:M23 family metallopeptidase [Burkholderiaceae bacterium]